MHGPDPTTKHPMKRFPRVCFITNTVSNPNIVIGNFTYYDHASALVFDGTLVHGSVVCAA